MEVIGLALLVAPLLFLVGALAAAQRRNARTAPAAPIGPAAPHSEAEGEGPPSA